MKEYKKVKSAYGLYYVNHTLGYTYYYGECIMWFMTDEYIPYFVYYKKNRIIIEAEEKCTLSSLRIITYRNFSDNMEVAEYITNMTTLLKIQRYAVYNGGRIIYMKAID